MVQANTLVMTPKIKFLFHQRCYEIEDANGCWIWRGFIEPNGYGRLSVTEDGVLGMYLAHRLSYMIYNQIEVLEPEAGLVLHKCPNGANPSCVNPEHLVLGTQLENIVDRQNGPRALIGENHGRATLTDEEVIEIRLEYKSGAYTQVELARNFNVTPSIICDIVNRRSWKHLP